MSTIYISDLPSLLKMEIIPPASGLPLLTKGGRGDLPYIKFFIFILCIWIMPLYAQEKEVTAEGEVGIVGSTTFGQAQQFAIQQARTAAIEQATGVRVSQNTLIVDDILQTSFIKTNLDGFIINEEIIKWSINSAVAPGGKKNQPPIPFVSVKIKATVKSLPTDFFRRWALNAEFPSKKQVFKNGEHATINLAAKEDLYFLIANYSGKGKINVIYPNSIAAPNFLAAGTSYVVPTDRKKYQIVIELNPGDKTASEAFFIFGFPKNPETEKINWLRLFPSDYDFQYAEFYNQITSLPIQWLAEKTLIYAIIE